MDPLAEVELRSEVANDGMQARYTPSTPPLHPLYTPSTRAARPSRWLNKVFTVNSIVSVSSPSDVREELVGELNSQVIRWLNKVLMVNSTVSVSSPALRRAVNAAASPDRLPLREYACSSYPTFSRSGNMLAPLTRLAPVPGICLLLSPDWLPLREYACSSYAISSRFGNMPTAHICTSSALTRAAGWCVV
eukprot:1178552-Prorocentrum_minimum.AAC.2